MSKSALILITMSFLFACTSEITEESTISNEFSTADDACDICLLEDDVFSFDKKIVSAKARGESEIIVDSLKAAQNQVMDELDEKCKAFKYANKRNNTRNNQIQEVARDQCIESFNFGSHLEKSRKEELYKILYDEMFQGISGFYINDNIYIETRRPIIDEEGQFYTYVYNSLTQKQEKTKVDDWDAWKQKELANWEKWMVKIDQMIFELLGEKYADLSELEKLILKYQLGDFNEG